MLNTQSSEFTESIQDQKNFQVFVRVRPQNKDDLQLQLSSRKSPDRFQKNNLSIQQQQQFQSLYGSSSPMNSPLISKQNVNSILNNCQAYQSMYGGAYNSVSQTDSIIRVDEENNTIYLNDPEYRNVDKREKPYPFDGVISENSTNLETFEKAVLPQLSGILEGYNATFFAYGITGSGKTHTIFGRNGGLEKQYSSYNNYLIQNSYSNMNNNGLDQNILNFQNQDKSTTDRGICYMAIEYLLQNLDKQNTSIKFSFLEIYNENVRDLLNGQNNQKNLTIIEDPATKSICVQDLKEYNISSISQIEELIQEGNQRRALAPTSGNQFSSRSHAILILTVQQRNIDPINKVEEILTSKLTIIDLAGSEKGSDKQGKGSLEGSNINRSLLTLGNCINILSEKKKTGHVPYRDSKLTRILKDTLGGNTKTVMIACISQNYSCLDETVNTLSYASRATNIKRKINKNITQELDYYQQKELIKELQNELAFFKCSKSGNNGIASVTPNSFNSNSCDNCLKNKKSILSYDCSNFESVQGKSTTHSSLDTKIKQEKQLIQGQIQEITEMIKQSLLLENGLGEDITDESIEQQIRIRNEQQGNQEEFLNRICNDLFQNIVESHQLISSLQEIEELLVQDYQKLLFYQKNPLQTPQVSGIINQLQDSIRENEEIKDKMKLVLETNQEQKQNLKYVLLRISNKKQIQMEYDLKMRKQQLELLDLLEIKSDLEKQLNIQNTVILEKDKLIQQINEENSTLKSKKSQQQKSFGGNNSQIDLPQTFSAIRTQACVDENGQVSKGQINQLIAPNKNNSKQAFTQQLLQQEQQQQQKNQLNFDQNKGYAAQQTQMQINNEQQQSQSNKQNQNSYKHKNNSLTPLIKDLVNNENQNQLQTQIPLSGQHNKGSNSQTSVQTANSPQTINNHVSITPKNEQKSSISLGFGSKTTGKMQAGTPSNQQSYNSANNFSSTQNNSSQETNFPLSFGSYNSSVPQISLTNSNIPTGLLKQSNIINSHQTQASSINSQLYSTQQLQQGNPSNVKLTTINQISNVKLNNPQEHEKENKKSDYSQDEYIQSILSAYSNNNSQIDAYATSINAQQLQQIPQQFTSLTQSNKQTALFTKSKSPSNQQTEFNVMNNILEQSRYLSPNIGQSSVIQQGLIQSKTLQGLKREPQNAVIDLSQNSAQVSTASSQGQGKNINSYQNLNSLQDKFGSPYQQQQTSSNQTLNSTGNNIIGQQSSVGQISLYKSRSQSKSGRYDNCVGDNIKQQVTEKFQLDDKKPFLEEQFYQNNNQFQYSGINAGVSQYSAEPLFGQQDKVQLLSPMDSYKNPMESRDTAFDHSNKKELMPITQNKLNDINSGPQNKNLNHIYNEYELQSANLHTHSQLYQDKLNAASNKNFQKIGQSRRLINYGMDDFDDDCEPKIMSRRSSDCNKLLQHINDSATNRNPLETESELDQDEMYSSSKKPSFVSSPQIHKTSRTIQAQNVNLKKKNFDVFENEV